MPRHGDYQSLFPAEPGWPEGFQYEEEVLPPGLEQTLLREIESLPFRAFKFQGYTGKRRVVSYGWQYDFNDRVLREADPLPEFLLPARELAARFAGAAPEQFPHVLVTEYAPGAGIGWHRDKGVFEDVVGLSLLSPCAFRLRRRVGERWERVTVRLTPRSAYLLRGPVRAEWEHSIPEAEATRYSLTFRTLRQRPRR